jgi:group I intron endonuclease
MSSTFVHSMLRQAPTTIGVYAITNTVNGKRYIGSAAQFERVGRGFRFRWREHLRELNAGRHHSQKLQRAWVKYGPDAFVFEVLEVVEPVGDATRAALLEAEQRHIDAHGIRSGYNVNPTAGSQLGYRHTPETKARIASSGMGRVNSPETIERMRLAQRARFDNAGPISESTREKQRAAAIRRLEKPGAREALAEIGRAAAEAQKGKPGKRGHKLSDEARANMRLAHAKRLADPDPSLTEKHRSAMEARRGIPMSPETREKMRMAAIERSKNPEYIKRMAEGVRKAHARSPMSEESRKKIGEAQRRIAQERRSARGTDSENG